MTRRERLTAALRGEPVDRPPVCFYEINGFTQNSNDADPYNIYTHPSWKPLLELARNRSDVIVLGGVWFRNAPESPLKKATTTEKWTAENGSLFQRTVIRHNGRQLTSLTRRDPDVNTVWQVEHLLKDVEDLRLWLELPEEPFGGEPCVEPILRRDREVGDAGLVALGCGDALCAFAMLFDMETFTVTALTENELTHQALRKAQRAILRRVAAVAEALPGRLWRIVGPEYASPPYLPPRLFREYVTAYDAPLVEAIQRHGGFARIHSHGRLKDILPHIAETGCMGLDPIEPPHQGDVSLAFVRERYGRQMTLFGNLEAADLEHAAAETFRQKVRTALVEGTAGEGRGFVLMPSACPYGRILSDRALENYEIMLQEAERLG